MFKINHRFHAAALAVGLAVMLASGCNRDAAPAEGAEASEADEPRGLLSGILSSEDEVRTVVIPAGTEIAVRTTTTVSSKSAGVGEEFVGSLAEPLMIGGEEVQDTMLASDLVIRKSSVAA